MFHANTRKTNQWQSMEQHCPSSATETVGTCLPSIVLGQDSDSKIITSLALVTNITSLPNGSNRVSIITEVRKGEEPVLQKG